MRLLVLSVSVIIALTATVRAEIIEYPGAVEDLCVLDGETILCVKEYTDSDNCAFYTLKLPGGERQPWRCDWSLFDEGWTMGNHIYQLHSSPDGQWVLFSLGVSYIPDEGESLPYEWEAAYAVVTVLSRADGSDAKALFLGIDAGGGPEYGFTSDSSRVVGSPIFACGADAPSYVDYINNEWSDPDTTEFNYVEVASGEHGYLQGLNTGDGFWKCPYSDNYRIENNCYEQHEFGNFRTGEILGKYTCPGEDPIGFVSGWVLEDAMLARCNDTTGLLYIDGRFVPAIEDWHVYCWLPDGTYLFSNDDGATVKYGKVDWSSFTVDWWVDMPEFTDYTLTSFYPLQDSSGVVMHAYPGAPVKYMPLSREDARP